MTLYVFQPQTLQVGFLVSMCHPKSKGPGPFGGSNETGFQSKTVGLKEPKGVQVGRTRWRPPKKLIALLRLPGLRFGFRDKRPFPSRPVDWGERFCLTVSGGGQSRKVVGYGLFHFNPLGG